MKKLNSLFAAAVRKSEFLIKPRVLYAHCDAPCGLYETDTMQHAAETVRIMTEKLLALQLPEHSNNQKQLEFHNTIARMVHTKEEWAQKCKQEILILWTDYFKDEHLAKFPDLHAKVWKATKLCSYAKRTVDMNAAQQLKEAVAEIAGIFAATKK